MAQSWPLWPKPAARKATSADWRSPTATRTRARPPLSARVIRGIESRGAGGDGLLLLDLPDQERLRQEAPVPLPNGLFLRGEEADRGVLLGEDKFAPVFLQHVRQQAP